MSGRKFLYFIRQAIYDVSNRKLPGAMSIVTIAASLFVLGVFLLASSNLQEALSKLGGKVHIIAYLDNGVPAGKITSIKKRLEAVEGVKGVFFVSKKEALERLRREMPEFHDLFEGLEQNPLPASFEISLSRDCINGDCLSQVAKKIQRISGIAEACYGREWVDRFNLILGILRFLGIAISSLLMIAVIFIISNTVKLNFYSRKEEVEVMRLVGATEAFIKAPYVIEGAILGLLGALCAVILLAIAYKIFSNKLAELAWASLGIGPLSFLKPLSTAIILTGGGLLGAFGGAFSFSGTRE